MKALFALTLLAPVLAQAQLNTKLTPHQFAAITAACGPSVPNDTLAAISRTESAFHPFALSINYPQTSARRAGFATGSMLLARQPRNLTEALGWATWFELHGYTVSVGLMQVNIQTARLYKLSLRQLFDPCQNIRAGATIIADYYHRTHQATSSTSEALLNAISAYNSGNTDTGYANGYVAGVYNNRRENEWRPLAKVRIAK